MNLFKWIDKRQQWWKIFVLIFTVSIVVVGYIGYKTYEYKERELRLGVGREGARSGRAPDHRQGSVRVIKE